MAYSRRSLKRKTTKKRTATKRKAPKRAKTSRGMKKPAVAKHRQTGYYQAVMDPIKGPLVGIPSFVPIDSHRARVRAVGDFESTGSVTRVYFNPRRMISKGAPDGETNAQLFSPIVVKSGGPSTAVGDNTITSFTGIDSNASYTPSDFQITTYSDYASNIMSNGDGIRGRVVGALIRVCNTSSANTRSGVFTALHERHHKTLETFTSSEIASETDAIIKPAADGSYINLLYRPVKPEEIEDWQRSPLGYSGEVSQYDGATNVDGTIVDQYPGFMCIEYNGSIGQMLHIEAYAIVEYVGESLSTLSRPSHLGGGKKAEVSDTPMTANDAKKKEAGTLVDLEPRVDEKHEKVRETLSVLQGIAKNHGASAHIEEIEMHRNAHLADTAYVSQANGGDLDAINEHIQALPDYVGDLKDYTAIHASEDGMNVVMKNPETGKVVISFAGTVNDTPAHIHEHWTVNNYAIAKGEDFFRDTARYQEASDLITETVAEFGPQNVHLVGHSQGGAVAMIGSAEHGVPATVFNPGIPLRGGISSGSAHVTLYRNPGDVVSVNSILAGKNLSDIEGGGFTIKTIPFKEGTINDKNLLETMVNAHDMEQFTALDEGVTVLGDNLVAVSRVGKVASAVGIAGAAVAAYDTAKETVQDWHADLEEHGTVKGSMEAVGDTALNVGKAVVDWQAVSSEMAVGAEIGEALFPPGGAIIGGVVGAVVGVAETIGIDKIAGGVKRLWHKMF